MIGTTRSITYTIDVVDSFYEGRGALRVSSDHPEIEAGREITVGKGRKGRVRVMVAVPDTVELGMYRLDVVLDGWHKASGGLGPRLEHTTKLELVEEIPGSGSGEGSKRTGAGERGPGEGSNVALKWTNHESQDGWTRATVGSIEHIPAHVLAEARPEYAELKSLGDVKIPTVVLNEEYPPFKKYLGSRSKQLTTVERPKEQYAIGVGVALLLLERETEERRKKNGHQVPDDEFIAEAQRAAARGVLAVMPSFDLLAREAGLTG
jgi:hypothetical protein